MQINSHLPVVFYPAKQADESPNRLPVVVDNQADVNTINRRSVTSRPVTETSEIYDNQQARYIRNFSLSNRETERDLTQNRLPAPVQAYLQVAEMQERPPQERLFDAMA